MTSSIRIPRRTVLKGLAAGAGALALPGAVRPLHAASVAPITIVINHPTWPFLITMDHAQAS